MYAYPLHVREKNGSLPIFFDCFHMCMIHIGLCEVSVVCETESLQERFFHALRTLRTANCQIAPFLMFPWLNSLI